MKKKLKIICIILARGGSKGLKLKNLKKVHGKPLIYYPIKDALSVKSINDVIVSTDHKLIAKYSLKYGANTRWCTASATNPGTFKQYIDRGFLAYLIDKNNKKTNNQNKLAFYFTNKNNLLTQQVVIYNQLDTTISEDDMIRSGWDILLLGDLITKLRTSLFEYKQQEKVRVEVSKTMQQLNQINYDSFFRALKTLRVNPENIEELRSALGMVKSSIKKISI
jgi:hypothetical protein